jgi:hypothetical protein
MNTAATRAEINRENAQYSTGPKTEEGKQRSSLNALRHGLTSQTVVLPGEDLELYHQHLASFQHDLRPFGADEHNLVQILADTSWRLHRVAVLESNLLTHGAFTQDDDAPNPDRTIKGLATLSLHGQRLNRQFESTLRLLKNIQRERKKENEGLAQTIDYIKSFENDGYIWDPVERGFVFRRPESNHSSAAAPAAAQVLDPGPMDLGHGSAAGMRFARA